MEFGACPMKPAATVKKAYSKNQRSFLTMGKPPAAFFTAGALHLIY